MITDRVRLSKFMSLLLRHRPHDFGLTLDREGWCKVEDLVDCARKNGFAVELNDIMEVVTTNDKQRFAISSDGTMIRANQGHSVEVELGLEPSQPPEILYHGTSTKSLEAILQRGLSRQKRHHVHLSKDRKTALDVGSRYGKAVLLLVDAAKMHRDGFQFFETENGVWLTDHVPVIYLREEGEPGEEP